MPLSTDMINVALFLFAEQNVMIKRLIYKSEKHKRGQSFLELSFVLLILALVLAGVVEYGFMINNYLHVLGGSREAARVYNSYSAFNPDGTTINAFYYRTVEQAATTMSPVMLDPSLGDDIIVSVFSVAGASVRRFPLVGGGASSNGWSLCANYAEYKAPYAAQGKLPPPELSADGWNHCPAHGSRLSDAEISERIGAGPHASQSGLLLVEILYNYPQILKLPLFTNSDFFGVKFSIIPDPIPLYVYTIMPISSAEPTQGYGP